MERNYQNGKIYKLYIPGLESFCYIGSTTETLSQRFGHHRHQAYSDKQNKSASSQMFIDEDIEPIIELIEAYSCNSKQELEGRERYWINQYPDCININIPTRTWKERWEQNRDHNLKLHNEWKKNNKDHIKEYDEAYKPKRKQNERNRLNAIYADPKAKEEWNAKRREMKNRSVECPICSYKTTSGNLWRHKKIHTASI